MWEADVYLYRLLFNLSIVSDIKGNILFDKRVTTFLEGLKMAILRGSLRIQIQTSKVSEVSLLNTKKCFPDLCI